MAFTLPDAAKEFSVLAATTVTSTGPTKVTGDVAVCPGSSVTGFPPGKVSGGVVRRADEPSRPAKAHFRQLQRELLHAPRGHDLTGKDLGGMVLKPGRYCFASSAQLTGRLTLDGGGDPDARFVFVIGSTLTTGSDAEVVTEGVGPDAVFWVVGSSATLGTGTRLAGTLLAEASITVTTGGRVAGRLVALGGAVTLDSAEVGPG